MTVHTGNNTALPDDLPVAAPGGTSGYAPGPYVQYPGVDHGGNHASPPDDLPESGREIEHFFTYYPAYYYQGPTAAPFYIPVNTFEFSATALIEVATAGALSEDVQTEFEGAGQVAWSTSTSLVRQRTFSSDVTVDLGSSSAVVSVTDFQGSGPVVVGTNAEFVRELSFDPADAAVELASSAALDAQVDVDPANAPVVLSSTASMDSQVDFTATGAIVLGSQSEVNGAVAFDATASVPVSSTAALTPVTTFDATAPIEVESYYTVQVEFEATSELEVASTSVLRVETFFVASATTVVSSQAHLSATEELGSAFGGVVVSSTGSISAFVELSADGEIQLGGQASIATFVGGSGEIELSSSAELETAVPLEPGGADLLVSASCSMVVKRAFTTRASTTYLDTLADLTVLTSTIQPPDPALPTSTPQVIGSVSSGGARMSFIPNRVR